MKTSTIVVILLLSIFAIFSTEAMPDGDRPGGAIFRDENGVQQCGPKYGKCNDGLCCSLHNECGNTVAHCNVSLGCKGKYGDCH